MRARDRGALKPVYHISFMPNHYTRRVIGAINLNCILSLWNFQNSKYGLTTDHEALKNIKLCSLETLIYSISIEFPKQKIKANHSKSLLNPNLRIHTRPKHKCRSIFSFLFLLN